MSTYRATYRGSNNSQFPFVVVDIPGLGEIFLAKETKVIALSPPTSGESIEKLNKVAKSTDGFNWTGKWGDIQLALHRTPDEQYLPPIDFDVVVLHEEIWECEASEIAAYVADLRHRRNRQIDDLRRELHQVKKDKQYWKAVAKDYERTLLAQGANRS